MARWPCALMALIFAALLVVVPPELLHSASAFVETSVPTTDNPPGVGPAELPSVLRKGPADCGGRHITHLTHDQPNTTADGLGSSGASLAYCQGPGASRRLFGCSDENSFRKERVLATGFHKTVWLVSVNGSLHVLKTSNRTGARERKHNEALDPRTSRQAHIRHEYRVARSLSGLHGLLPYSGYCSRTPMGVAWSLWPFLPRGTFPVAGSHLATEAQLQLALSVAQTFACLADLPGGRYGYVLDNSRKQYGVDDRYRVWLLDYDGVQLLPKGQSVDGDKRCTTLQQCRVGQAWDQVPEMRCLGQGGPGRCHGLDSRSMVYVLGHEFLARLPAVGDLVQPLLVEDPQARPTAASVASQLEDRLQRCQLHA
eukprot:GGOE01046695.1.p1 GENE.GGOE01046695.1~~GGOE01046695.1.p1  ORF type:complete len:370 (+),score=76.63 GGOE01046695.1:57-1166(+)